MQTHPTPLLLCATPNLESAMNRFWNAMKRLVQDEAGATMIEYGLMVALIALISIVTVAALGISTDALFKKGDNALQNALGG